MAGGDVSGCLGALREIDASFARLVCVVPVEVDANPTTGELALCGGAAEGSSDLGNLFTGGVACDDIKFATLTAGATGLDLRNELVLASAISNNPVASVATVDVTTSVPTTSACTFVLRPETAGINPSEAPPQVALIKTTGADKLLVPVVVRRATCASRPLTISCSYQAGSMAQTDGVEVCARAP